jgi:hypothetical protein
MMVIRGCCGLCKSQSMIYNIEENQMVMKKLLESP